jgi:hypothetical protein
MMLFAILFIVDGALGLKGLFVVRFAVTEG